MILLRKLEVARQNSYICEKLIKVLNHKKEIKTIYRLCNNLFTFWYRFISLNFSIIGSAGRGSLCKTPTRPYSNEHTGKFLNMFVKNF